MARNEVKQQRETAVQAAATILVAGVTPHFVQPLPPAPGSLDGVVITMGEGLPGGQALVYDANWRLLGRGGDPAAPPTIDQLKALAAAPPFKVAQAGQRFYSIRAIRDGGALEGYAVYSFAPRTISQIWFPILWRNALVLVLALAVIAPFLLPLARRALSPVTRLEKAIAKRTAQDKSKLADNVDDAVLKPLLTAIDDAHERSEAAMKRALRMAYADPATRLPNRLRFMSRLESLIDKGQGATVLLAVCDLDAFRKINVDYGPRVADEALATIGQRLRACADEAAPGQFFLGRIGADQFGVIAPAAEREKFVAFLAAAERAIAEPLAIDRHHLRITGAFGAAAAPEDAQNATDLLKQAELALKEAKLATSQRRFFFDQRLLQRARERTKLEAELREGLDRNEFIAVFQPKVKLESGELCGAEALARWRRPDGAVVSPGVFVPIAEELGLISKLGNAVMRDACFAAAEWHRRGLNARIAVNVSPYQFNESDFIGQVYQALDDSRLDPRMLELEITESAAVAEPERVARVMWPLRNRGVRLAIDDFGTGHSNFATVTRLPFDVFKIDQQFVRALDGSDSHAPAIVEMILAMAEALGQETVAEGVETREQADFLLRRNCTIGQGYWFSPPLPADEFDAFVRSWRPRPLTTKFAA
jgi:diguanylate cyclase (GGDEF)-like protein